MDKDWVLLSKETKRWFAKATWVPLRASQRIKNGSDLKEVGFVEEVFALGSVGIPPEHRKLGERLKWTDVGIGHSVQPYAYEDGYYSPIDQHQYNDKQPIGIELIFEHPQPVVGGRRWIINPDLVVALRLVKEGNEWVRPEEDFAVVVREHFDPKRNHTLIEVKQEFLLDYLAARGMSLRLSQYRQRVENVSTLQGTDYVGLENEDVQRDGGHFVLHIKTLDEIWGGEWAMFRVWRTDVDEEDDAPVMGPETDKNVGTEDSRGRRTTGLEGTRVAGEFWRDEWIEDRGLSTRVRGDDEPTPLEFIVDTDGTRLTSAVLDDEDVGRWLWFKPEVVKAFLGRRGFSLDWYTAETGGLHSTSAHITHFGLNSSDYLTVYAYDIARLPTWEQRIWAAYNVSPEGGVSKELLAAQVRTTPANTKAPEVKLKELMKATADVFFDRFGGPLYTHELDARTPTLSRFDGTDDASLLRLAKELTRQFVDRLNLPFMQQISTHEKKSKLGSIKLLESILGSIGSQELARRMVAVLVGVYDLRTGDAHPTSSKIEEAFSLAEIDRSKSRLRQAEQMIDNYARAIWGIGRVLYDDLEGQKAAAEAPKQD